MVFEKSDNTLLLMAKFADYSYSYAPTCKVGKNIFQDWYYFQPDNISEEIKSSAFCAVNNLTKEVVIVFKGSEPSPFNIPQFIKDWCISDVRMLLGKAPLNFSDFVNYVVEIKKEFTGFKYYLTGHSLGGSVAQLIGALEDNKDTETYTFNAFGVEPLLKDIENQNFSTTQSPDNIKNFIVDMDLVSEHNKHIGNVYIIKYEKRLANSIFSIISETPKVFSNLPYKIRNSICSYFKFLNMAIKKADAHLMNNFKNGFEYKNPEE